MNHEPRTKNHEHTNSETLVKVEGVSKKFCKSLKRSFLYGAKDVWTELSGGGKHDELREGEFWAVKDISFELKRGECLGLIGHNGAGKSTLLKMLNGLIKPDQGRIEMRGRIGALIELGAGFNPILTGRENIYNKGAVLGFSKQEIDEKFDSIVEFAELEEFIDMPVQNYSSGMKVRLGFSVSAQMEPDVLIIDEVLAVGDLSFKIKCFNALNVILKNSAVVFVSHAMHQVGKLCNHVIYLQQGHVEYDGYDVNHAIQEYMNIPQREMHTVSGEENISIDKVIINGEEYIDTYTVQFNKPFVIEFEMTKRIELNEIEMKLVILNQRQMNVAEFFCKETKLKLNALDKDFSIIYEVPSLTLNFGTHYMNIFIVNCRTGENIYKSFCSVVLNVEYCCSSYTGYLVPAEIRAI